MEKFLIVDGNSILNRAFYGVNAKMTSKIAGIHTNAIYGFLNIFWMIEEKFKPDYVAVSFDLKAPTFRHEMYDKYKAQRKPMPDELKEQVPVIKDVLKALNVSIIQIEGYEADDVLGTVASKNKEKGIFTYILTGDRDSFQLISENTTVILPKNGGSKTEYNLYTPELLKATYGIEPYQVIEVKALMGDSSDNIPGVKGVGEKTAYFLIENYKTIDELYLALQNDASINITPSVKNKLITDKQNAYMSKTLATIVLDVPIDIDYSKCKLATPNLNETYKIFKKLEFSKFIAKFDFSNIDSIDHEKLQDENKHIKIDNVKDTLIIDESNIKEKFDYLVDILNREDVSYLYNNPSLSYFNKALEIDCEILCIYDNLLDTSIIMNLEKIKALNSSLYADIIKLFVESKSSKIGYNIKQDIRYFFNYVDNISNFDFDIMIAYYLLESTKSDYKLEYILDDLYGIILDTNISTNNVQLNLFDELQNNNEFNNIYKKEISNISMIIKCLYNSKKDITLQLENNDMLKLFNDIEMPLCTTLASMEHIGMHVDTKKIEEFDIFITKELENITLKIYELAGEQFNINSPKQLGIILFEKLNLKGAKKTKTGYSTDKEVLESLEGEHEIISHIIKFRTLSKLKSTFVDALKEKIENDSRIHTTFMQTVTSTGRLSSVEPNLQNIPIRQEIGGKIRTFFTATNNNSVILDADYSQIELRMLADISNDEKMINAFNNNIDIHTATASQVFNVEINSVTPELRRKAKAVNFGIVYGISQYGLSKNISSTPNEAKVYIDNYLKKYNGISNFMNDIVIKAKEQGFVTTIFGRRRYIKELESKNKNLVKFGERIAMNTPIQGSAADIIKLAMNRIYKRLIKNNLKSKLIMQVHDELLIESPKDEIEIASQILKEEMENVIKLKVPLTVDLNVGTNWYEAK